MLAGALSAVRALRPDAVIQGGDLIDNDQANELALALAVMAGGHARPGSGGPGYLGVQSPDDADPFYYRPDLDAPVHRGLLQAATASFASPGAGRPWLPVLGDHDILVAGEIAPTAADSGARPGCAGRLGSPARPDERIEHRLAVGRLGSRCALPRRAAGG